MVKEFQALVVNKTDSDFSLNIQPLTLDDLSEGEVTIKVAYSSVNYKDGLASIPDGKVVNNYPFIPGIDLAGTVNDSNDSRFKVGDEVIATSYDIGVSHFGGFSEYARIKADWIVPLPEGLTLKEAMAYGTAGFTAALSIQQLEEHGVTPENGNILVTGSTGGVGSLSVAMLAKLGYNVVASTGKENEHGYLKQLGAKKIVSREDVNPEKVGILGKQLWAGVIDTVGGKTLASSISNTKYDGTVTACGNTGGVSVPTNVFPFILRGVNLIGIDSVYCPMTIRKPLWERMATELKPDSLLSDIGQEITLDELPQTLAKILKGQIRGRTLIKFEN